MGNFSAIQFGSSVAPASATKPAVTKGLQLSGDVSVQKAEVLALALVRSEVHGLCHSCELTETTKSLLSVLPRPVVWDIAAACASEKDARERATTNQAGVAEKMTSEQIGRHRSGPMPGRRSSDVCSPASARSAVWGASIVLLRYNPATNCFLMWGAAR